MKNPQDITNLRAEEEEDAYIDDTQIAETVPEDENADAPMDDDEEGEAGEPMELEDDGHDIGINDDGNIESWTCLTALPLFC